MDNETTTDAPATGEQDPTVGEIKVPEGAKDPDAVKAAIQSERDAAKAAKQEAATAKAEAATARDALASFQAESAQTVEKLQADLTVATEALTPAKLLAEKYEVADAKGMPLAAARLLQGDDRAAIEANADALIALGVGKSAPADFDGGTRETPKAQVKPEEAHQGFIGALLSGRTPEQ